MLLLPDKNLQKVILRKTLSKLSYNKDNYARTARAFFLLALLIECIFFALDEENSLTKQTLKQNMVLGKYTNFSTADVKTEQTLVSVICTDRLNHCF